MKLAFATGTDAAGARSGFKLWLSPGTTRLLIIALLVLIWQVGAEFWGDPLFMAPPSQTAVALANFVHDPEVIDAVLRTLYELVAAFVIAVGIALPVGLAVGLSRFVHGAFYPIVLMCYSTPQATILPLVVLFFGIGPESKIAFGVTHAIFPIIVNVVAGVQGIKPSLLTCARSMGASKRQMLWNVIIPYMVPSFFTGLRLAMTADLVGVLLAELYVSQAGVGHFTRLFTESFAPAKLFALIACLAAISVVLNESVRRAERRMSRWHE